jgi:hypothetical protein
MFDRPDWRALVGGFRGRDRQEAALAGLVRLDEALAAGDRARARDLALGLAPLLDAAVEEPPDGMPYRVAELRPSPRRAWSWACGSLEEVALTLRRLAMRREADWATGRRRG